MRSILLSASLFLVACGQAQPVMYAQAPGFQMAPRPAMMQRFAASNEASRPRTAHVAQQPAFRVNPIIGGQQTQQQTAPQTQSAPFQFKRIQNMKVSISDGTGGWSQVSVDYDVAYPEQIFTRRLSFYYHLKNKQVDASRISASGDQASREMLVAEAQALMNLQISF
ncbi:MAG: hypothetical protein IGS03_02255 [Candidatus Sericytochromatia bacterium]|nr:hypothetical protein [Candidatus Sericytochromatia bacterium]